jgi:hypothetical protein
VIGRVLVRCLVGGCPPEKGRPSVVMVLPFLIAALAVQSHGPAVGHRLLKPCCVASQLGPGSW